MSYHQQTSRSQYLAKHAAPALSPPAVFHVSAIPALVTCHFLPPRNFPYPHTPRMPYPVNHVAPLGMAIQPIAGGQGLSIATDTRVASVAFSVGCVGNVDPAHKGGCDDRPLGSQARTPGSLLSDLECSPVWRTEHGAARLPAHVLAMWWNTSSSPVALAPRVLQMWLVPVNHTARLVVNFISSYPRQDRGAVCSAL